MQIDETLKAFAPLEEDSTTISQDIDELFTSIKNEVANEQQATEEAAGVLEGLVDFLSAVGATIGGFGNWLGGKVGATDTAAAREEAVGV